MEHRHFCASADVASFAGRYAERATSNNSSVVRFSCWTLSFFLFSNQSTEKLVELIWRKVFIGNAQNPAKHFFMYRHNESLNIWKVNYQGRIKKIRPGAFFQPAVRCCRLLNTVLRVFRPVVFWITCMVTGSPLSGESSQVEFTPCPTRTLNRSL